LEKITVTSPVFVTGAAGFIGRFCALELHSQDHTVIGMDVFPMYDVEDWGISYFYQTAADGDSLETISEAHGLPGAIIHCAGSGSVPASFEDPKGDFQKNVLSVLDVLEFSRRHKGNVALVFPSSAAVYGNLSDQPLKESKCSKPISPYGVHKKIVEDLSASYGRNFGVPSICLRLFSVYGEGLRKQLLWDACQKAHKGNFCFSGSGEEKRDWLHVSDAASLMCQAMKHASPLSPILNGGTGKGTTTADILDLLGAQWEPSLRPVFDGKARSGDPVHLVADISVMESWDMKPQMSLSDGVQAYVSWFKREIIND
jgi:UDP-glucose 4-epimerase